MKAGGVGDHHVEALALLCKSFHLGEDLGPPEDATLDDTVEDGSFLGQRQRRLGAIDADDFAPARNRCLNGKATGEGVEVEDASAAR